MRYKKHNSQGFTIVELMIVIVVIGILATLVVVTFNGTQQKMRDSKRKTDITAIQAALESYYGNNNTYPTVQDFNSSSWRSANLKSFNSSYLQDPKGTAEHVISGTKPSSISFAYNVTPAGCDDSATTTNPCTNYGIYAKLEADNSIISKVSNN